MYYLYFMTTVPTSLHIQQINPSGEFIGGGHVG